MPNPISPTNPFRPGDRVRRMVTAISEGYDVGHDDFTVTAIDYDLVTDPNGQLHSAANLERVGWKPAAETSIGTIIAQSDAVNPAHYKTAGGLEAIDVLESFGLVRDGRLFNVGKYILRAGKKDSELQDLKKAKWYLDRFIADLESNA